MRALLCPELGAVPLLTEIAAPVAGPEQVRIRVAAAGVNFADTLLINGKYQEKLPFPLIPGMEVSGWVDQVGDGVTTCHPGQRVMAVVTGGAFAEMVVAQASDVFVLPDGLDMAAAAGFAVAYGTSHLGLVGKAGLKAGETLVVHGAGSGVGLTAVEVGAALGATIIATAGGTAKLELARTHGAHHLIDNRSQDIRETVKSLTGGRGADVVYDPVGGDVFDASLRSVAPNGRILVIGFASGTVPQIPANILLVKNITVIGYWWGAYRRLAPQLMRDSMTEALDWWARGLLKPHVGTILPLTDGAKALEMLTQRQAEGKVVIDVGLGG